MRFSNAVAVVLIALSFAASADAATYYVATNGNDGANGSLATPFKTLTKAASVTRPGDVVEVRGGVYMQTAQITATGTANARITIRAYSQETPIFDGTGT